MGTSLNTLHDPALAALERISTARSPAYRERRIAHLKVIIAQSRQTVADEQWWIARCERELADVQALDADEDEGEGAR
jgi:hypothetical protein